MSSILRNNFAKYTSNSIEVKRMTHAQFLDFIEFLSNQPNVDYGKDIRDTLASYDQLKVKLEVKNKSFKDYRELIDVITYLLINILLFGAFVYLLVVIVFFFTYRKDVIKRTIGFQLLGIVVSAISMLVVLWFLLSRIVQQFKNIIFLM